MAPTWCSCGRRDHGTQSLSTPTPPTTTGPEAGGIDHFGFRLKDRSQLDAAITAVEAAGGRLVERGEHVLGRAFAHVADPDGYLIEL